MAHARLQRDALESIDKAWAARTITNDRIAALNRELSADHKVIDAYQKEYELGQRSLIDLLNAQNSLFNALVALESTRGVAVFADYQLLAAMGQLLEYLKMPHPVDAEPLVEKPFGLIPTKLPPILLRVPEPGSEPLNIIRRSASTYAYASASAGSSASGRDANFAQRWPGPQDIRVTSWADSVSAPRPGQSQGLPLALPSSQASSYAPEQRSLPAWLPFADKVN
jgi:adhesin transport system outer membrane protein